MGPPPRFVVSWTKEKVAKGYHLWLASEEKEILCTLSFKTRLLVPELNCNVAVGIRIDS